MQAIESLVTSGRIVDIVLALIALEIAVIAALQYRRGRVLSVLPLVANVGAGASLFMALRVSLTSGSWQWISVWLLLALAFHALDIASRWEGLTGARQH